jgi:hypothetical protein
MFGAQPPSPDQRQRTECFLGTRTLQLYRPSELALTVSRGEPGRDSRKSAEDFNVRGRWRSGGDRIVVAELLAEHGGSFDELRRASSFNNLGFGSFQQHLKSLVTISAQISVIKTRQRNLFHPRL